MASPQPGRGYRRSGRTPGAAFAGYAPEAAWLAASFLFLGAVALAQFWVGPELSLALLYLVPVAAAAWWAGRIQGVVLSLAAALAWHWVNVLHTPGAPAGPRLWNECVYLGFFLTTAALVSALRATGAREKELAQTDPLTGSASGRAFYENVHVELERSRRTGRPVTLAFLDLDDFQQLNDRLGRTAGDRVLRRVTDLLRRNLRPADVVGRLGGDEFGLLLPETDGPGAALVLARLQKNLLRITAETGCPVSASVGAATFPVPPDANEVAQFVAAQLAAAKSGGKGRLEHEVVESIAASAAGPALERRVAPRFACHRMALVHRLEAGASPEDYGLVYDLSAEGVGLHTERKLPEGAVVTIEALTVKRARPLLARVVRSAPRGGGWSHGCVLAARLDAGDLRLWLSGSAVGEPGPGEPAGTAGPQAAPEGAFPGGPLPETIADLQLFP
jgi:diguanylate cyclase (GGDEF)-like protein